MSNDSSASETTPLRRPDSENIEDVTSQTTAIAATNTTETLPNTVHRHQGTTSSAAGTVKSTSAASYQNNNNNIEIHLISNYTDSELKMETNKRILCRVGLDVLVLLCVGFPILGFFLWGESYKRGFFCDDESLMHPFHESTVRNWMLYIIGIAMPIAVIVTVELIRFKQHQRRMTGNGNERRYVFMDYEIPDWLLQCYKKIGVFAFGAALGQLTTDIAKYSIGRLRPHFFAVCQPRMPDGTTCADSKNHGIYIENFRCDGVGSTARMLKEVSLSFPSGHSSFTFYTMIYLAMYLQMRMTWRGSKLVRHLLQFALVMIAWFTALSRVSDYKHHWSDVLAGSVVGAICAIVVAKYVSDLFVTHDNKVYLPRTTQDMHPQTVTNGH